jgi:Lysine methyltransferase
VLNQCIENISSICGNNLPFVRVAKLNWHDFLRVNGAAWEHAGLYDTVLACDCAYLYPDILALATTLKKLLRNNPASRCYIFGPNNRGGLYELLRQLRKDSFYQVHVEEIEMTRYRLSPSIQGNVVGDGGLDDQDFLEASSSLGRRQIKSKFYSQTGATILLATISLRPNEIDKLKPSISDID